MRKLGVIAVLTTAVLLGLASAAGATEQVVTLNPLGFILRVYNLRYERAMTEAQSWVAGGQFLSWNLGNWAVTGIGAAGGLRFYPRRTAPAGFYYGPEAGVAHVSVRYTGPITKSSSTGQGVTLSAGGLAGYQWVTGGGFAVDLSAGLTFSFGGVSAGNQAAPLGGVSPSLGLNLGYAW